MQYEHVERLSQVFKLLIFVYVTFFFDCVTIILNILMNVAARCHDRLESLVLLIQVIAIEVVGFLFIPVKANKSGLFLFANLFKNIRLSILNLIELFVVIFRANMGLQERLVLHSILSPVDPEYPFYEFRVRLQLLIQETFKGKGQLAIPRREIERFLLVIHQ